MYVCVCILSASASPHEVWHCSTDPEWAQTQGRVDIFKPSSAQSTATWYFSLRIQQPLSKQDGSALLNIATFRQTRCISNIFLLALHSEWFSWRTSAWGLYIFCGVVRSVSKAHFADGPASILCRYPWCFHHSSDDRIIHHSETMEMWVLVNTRSCLFPKLFGIFVSNPNKGSFELCEAYRWHSMGNKEIIAASLNKQFLVQI